MTDVIERTETLDPTPAYALGDLLGVPVPDLANGAGLPLLWHWVYLLERPPIADLGVDGHPVRGTLPGFAYQTGNLLAAVTANAQFWIARQHGNDLAFAMSAWIAGVAVLLALLAWIGPEARGVRFGQPRPGTGG